MKEKARGYRPIQREVERGNGCGFDWSARREWKNTTRKTKSILRTRRPKRRTSEKRETPWMNQTIKKNVAKRRGDCWVVVVDSSRKDDGEVGETSLDLGVGGTGGDIPNGT